MEGGTSDSYVPQSLPAGEQNEHLSSSDWGSKIMGRDLEVIEIREVWGAGVWRDL